MSPALLLATALLLPAPPASDPPPVAADATWVAHLDVAAALQSNLLQQVLAIQGLSLQGLPWSEVEERLGLDPRQTVRGVTAYGTGERPEDAVVLVETDVAFETVLDRLPLLLRRDSVQVGGLSLDRWQEFEDGGETVHSYLARREDGDERLLVLSPDPQRVAAAVAVLRAEAPALAGSAAHGRRPGTLLSVQVPRGLAELAATAEAPQVARLLESLQLQLGEQGSRMFLEVEAVTVEAEDARQVVEVVQGALALAAIAGGSQPELEPLLPLLQGLSVTADDRRVRLTFEGEVALLAELARDAQAEVDADVRVEFGRAPRPIDGDERWR